MSMGPGIVGPGSYPIRDPKTRPERVGRIFNTAGKYDMGRVKWAGQTPFAVERATRVNATQRTSRGIGE